MSNRTIVELNHDHGPRDGIRDLLEWALLFRHYLGNADSTLLPKGVTFLHYRHHSEPCPIKPPKPAVGDWRYRAWVRDLADKMIADEVGKALATQASAEAQSAVANNTPHGE